MGETAAQRKNKSAPASTGHRKGKFAKYFANTAMKKLRHVLARQGESKARVWATEKGLTLELRKLLGEVK